MGRRSEKRERSPSSEEKRSRSSSHSSSSSSESSSSESSPSPSPSRSSRKRSSPGRSSSPKRRSPKRSKGEEKSSKSSKKESRSKTSFKSDKDRSSRSSKKPQPSSNSKTPLDEAKLAYIAVLTRGERPLTHEEESAFESAIRAYAQAIGVPLNAPLPNGSSAPLFADPRPLLSHPYMMPPPPPPSGSRPPPPRTRSPGRSGVNRGGRDKDRDRERERDRDRGFQRGHHGPPLMSMYPPMPPMHMEDEYMNHPPMDHHYGAPGFYRPPRRFDGRDREMKDGRDRRP